MGGSPPFLVSVLDEFSVQCVTPCRELMARGAESGVFEPYLWDAALVRNYRFAIGSG